MHIVDMQACVKNRNPQYSKKEEEKEKVDLAHILPAVVSFAFTWLVITR